MIRIKVIAVGKLHYKELEETVDRFVRMVSRFARMEIVEIPESRKSFPYNLKEEGMRIIQSLRDEFVVITDRNGVEMSSEEFALNIVKKNLDIGRNISFVIGGHQGLSEEVKRRGEIVLSFSKMTFGHNIFRVMLLEQIYRAFSIIFETEYHK